jgi:IS30 family transposase
MFINKSEFWSVGWLKKDYKIIMPKLTIEQHEEINVLYQQGKSSTELGKQFGVDHTTILYHVNPEIKRKRGYKYAVYKELKKKSEAVCKFTKGSYYQELLNKNDPKDLPISILYKHRMIKR